MWGFSAFLPVVSLQIEDPVWLLIKQGWDLIHDINDPKDHLKNHSVQ